MAAPIPPRHRCQKCGDLIPPARVDALIEAGIDVSTCIYCSDVPTRTIRDVEVDGACSAELVRSVQHPDRG